MQKSRTALALFSGGLDSLLSVLVVRQAGVRVIPLFFRTPFFTEERALRTCEQNGLQLEVIDISDRFLIMMEHPFYGFGKNFNPCIDCHGLMFNLAGELLDHYKADFLISGEVLGQRPMSQRKDALNAVAKLSGYKDLLVRPLSQQLLPDTRPVREGWIIKDALLAISGRSRKPQMELVRHFGISEVPSPGGGCLLTDRNFTARFRDLVEHQKLDLQSISLLRFGRHFRLNSTAKLIIGRDEPDNMHMLESGQGGLFLLNLEIPGPLGLLTPDSVDDQLVGLAASLLAFYNKKSPAEVRISYGKQFPLTESVQVTKASEVEVMKYMIRGQVD